jgi:hypothetical protein
LGPIQFLALGTIPLPGRSRRKFFPAMANPVDDLARRPLPKFPPFELQASLSKRLVPDNRPVKVGTEFIIFEDAGARAGIAIVCLAVWAGAAVVRAVFLGYGEKFSQKVGHDSFTTLGPTNCRKKSGPKSE